MAGAGPIDCVPGKQLLGHSSGDRGEVHCHLKALGWPVGGLGRGSGAFQDTAPSLLPEPSAHHPLKARWAGEPQGRRQGSTFYLTLHLPTTTLRDSCPNPLTICCSLTVGCLWAGPTAVLTNSRAGPLTVTPWQSVACEWGGWGLGPAIAEQDH